MKFAPSLVAAIFGTASTIALIQPTPTRAQAVNSVSTIARQVTVRIDGQNPGSGVIISRQGQLYTVLTASHVVQTEDEYEVITPDGQKHRLDYKLVKKLPGVDLALVSFTSTQNYRVVEMGRSSQLTAGVPAYVAGFPLQGVRTAQPTYRFSGGEIAAQASKPLAGGYALAYFNDTFSGMSGGPVLNQQGQLVGIHGAAKLTGYLPEIFTDSLGVQSLSGRKIALNLAIPIDTFLRLVPQVATNLKFPPVPPQVPATQVTADDLLIRSVEQEAAGKLSGGAESALSLVNQSIEQRPNYAAAYFHRGNVIANFVRLVSGVGMSGKLNTPLSEYRTRISDSYTRAISLNPKFTAAYINRGEARLISGDIQGAISDCTEAIRLDPTADAAYYNRALAHADLKNFPAAMADFDQAIRLNPYYTLAYYRRGRVRFDLKDYQGAIGDYDRAIQLNPNSIIHNNRGLARAELGDTQGAIADYTEAIRLDPKYIFAYNNRGRLRRQLQDTAGAIADFSEAIRLKPSETGLYINRAFAYEQAGNKQAAIADFKKALELASTVGNSKLQQLATYHLQRLQR